MNRKWIVSSNTIFIPLVTSFVFILLLLHPNFITNKENYNNILNPLEVLLRVKINLRRFLHRIIIRHLQLLRAQ